jgi:NAD(P)-dependent dehydrogenase (short-subunit alcohol dehydrogenase family)
MSISIDLAGQVAVVTGGGSGIGEAIARTLARAGATVAIADISLEGGQRVAKEIEADGGRAIAVALDLSDRASIETGIAEVVDQLGKIDHLVNNAAAWAIKLFADHSPAEIDKVVGITLTGTVTVTQIALPHIVAAGGSVVIISSDGARIGEAYMSVYAGAKAGLIGFAKSVAREVGRKGVRINVIAPGTTQTPGSAGFIEAAGGAEKMAKAYPLGRLGEPQDIANAALFLVSPLSSWVTGQVLSVSGGFTMTD